MMNWNDKVRIGSADKIITPEAGMIVKYIDHEFWELSDRIRAINTHWQEAMTLRTIPILPAVTPGCGYTREQVLAAFNNPTYGDYSISLGYVHDNHEILAHFQSPMFHPAERYFNGVDHPISDFGPYIVNGLPVWPSSLAQAKSILQRFEVLMAWWEQSNASD